MISAGIAQLQHLKDLLGDGIFTVDGEKWREQRKVSSREFSARDVSSIVFRENAVKLANVVSEAVVSNQPMDIQDLFMKSTLDTIFRVAFGFDLDRTCGSNEEGATFSRAFDDASEITACRYVDVLWKIKKALNVGLEAKLKENIRVVDEFVYKLNNSKIEHMQQELDDCVHLKKENILSRFLKLSEADPKYLREIILNFVMAGKDTTATTLSWIFYMLCKHPLSQGKAAQEIIEATDSNGIANISAFAARVSEEALEKMHYLHAALTETLRLYPPVTVDPKMCLSDDTMRDGFHVKKGDVVAYQPYMQWEGYDSYGVMMQKSSDQKDGLMRMVAFSRRAPSSLQHSRPARESVWERNLVNYRQMKMLTAVLLRFFVFRLSDESKAVKYKTMINLHVDGELSLRAFHRADHKPN